MRVNNSPQANGPEFQKPDASVPAGRSSGSGAVAERPDEVAFSPAGSSAFSNRSDKINALKALVNSSNYAPSPADIGKKLVAEALSRPADRG